MTEFEVVYLTRVQAARIAASVVRNLWERSLFDGVDEDIIDEITNEIVETIYQGLSS